MELEESSAITDEGFIGFLDSLLKSKIKKLEKINLNYKKTYITNKVFPKLQEVLNKYKSSLNFINIEHNSNGK